MLRSIPPGELGSRLTDGAPSREADEVIKEGR
jgi:hypothetical protein